MQTHQRPQNHPRIQQESAISTHIARGSEALEIAGYALIRIIVRRTETGSVNPSSVNVLEADNSIVGEHQVG